jgi:hypothetical protein
LEDGRMRIDETGAEETRMSEDEGGVGGVGGSATDVDELARGVVGGIEDVGGAPGSWFIMREGRYVMEQQTERYY